MNAISGFFKSRRLRSLQPVAPELPPSSWVKDVLNSIDLAAMDKPQPPEPEMDHWLVDNAARVGK